MGEMKWTSEPMSPECPQGPFWIHERRAHVAENVGSAYVGLITAAPDLYEALRFFVEAEDTGLEGDELEKFSELARAALAKARGDA